MKEGGAEVPSEALVKDVDKEKEASRGFPPTKLLRYKLIVSATLPSAPSTYHM